MNAGKAARQSVCTGGEGEGCLAYICERESLESRFYQMAEKTKRRGGG